METGVAWSWARLCGAAPNTGTWNFDKEKAVWESLVSPDSPYVQGDRHFYYGEGESLRRAATMESCVK